MLIKIKFNFGTIIPPKTLFRTPAAAGLKDAIIFKTADTVHDKLYRAYTWQSYGISEYFKTSVWHWDII